MTRSGPIDLVGTKEAAELLGMRRSNFLRDVVPRPDFPAPIARLAATPVWRREELEAWRDARGKRTRRLSSLRLSPAATRWLPEARRRIVRRFRPRRIILFGSQARGDAGPESDVDLLVVLDEVDNARDVRTAIRLALGNLPIGKDVLVTTPRLIEEYGELVGTVLRPALREGITIYERG
jgi:uncharacterized protein